MKLKTLGRAACVAALAGACIALPVMSGCSQSDHPEAEIKIEFNDETYTLQYKMYRNMYPQTVQHFIEIADNGFYDDTIIHDYELSGYWYGGGYSYDSEIYSSSFEDKNMSSYLEQTSKEAEYYNDLFLGNKLTPSVYRSYSNGEHVDALPTVIGEITKDNQHKIEKGALKSSFGALRMWYSAKDTDVSVVLNKQGSPAEIVRNYSAHSATSLFTIQVSNSTSTDNNYCIFGVLQNTGVLTELRAAISDYISNDPDVTSTTFTQNAKIYVDNYDEIIEKRTNTGSFDVPKKPIIIRSVRITKY